MRTNFKAAKGAPAPPPPPRKRERTDKKFSRHNAARAGPSTQNAVELTRVQQLEAKAARDTVLATTLKASPLIAKKFVEAISLDVDVDAARQLLLSSKALTALPSSIGVLCQQLRKLDVAGNDLTDLSPLASLQYLSNLNVSRNPRLASLKGLSGTCLSVLSISYCAVESLVGLEHTALSLRTFIANDNRLQFQSPIFRSESVVPHQRDEEEGSMTDMDAAAPHLPASLRTGVETNAVAMRNYAIFATFQQCETVVLSRNTQLVQSFPAWSAEELAVQCGDRPKRPAHDSGKESGNDSSAEESDARRATHRGDGGPREAEPEADAQTHKLLKHAVALAHPLSVFERLPRLKKLSLSGCALHSLPSRWFLPMVTELRLAQNHLASLQPDGVILRSLHILDISNNLFISVITLRRCRFLEQLSLRGNPLVEEGATHKETMGRASIHSNSNDKAATEEGKDGDPTAPSDVAIPLHVQRSVARLFPSLKLLDHQPVLSAAEMQAATERERDVAAAAAAAPSQQQVHDAKRTGGGADGGGEPRETSTREKTVGGRGAKSGASLSARAPACKAARVDPAVIAAEAAEKDVVVEAPSSVLKTAHAPIIRRERTLLKPGTSLAGQGGGSSNVSATRGDARKKETSTGGANSAAPTVLGQAAVDKLLEQSRKTNAW
ncbi:hypothetical protein ABB37_08666 [Leptomonas pyrrhocoris]|uniref:Uncharacterized protein n=1 Tax=Leptomonas pyrrhocoris TaxID=157538 RepID=A0A0N0DS34_LEPPY|nr:hypothetical protein ABB37_08666 [Leptomonas pyrrhocoris]XP_015653830.1 hypothetical protein ABB37_08666 [Leptomonas pyrrhocoris]KPA75390.1 hypothetical protein ABB37_08666 [Leptomonas pyrrhocoris]KPA75391.1 hypothetical protein ABB37_08666 [Leptomonas pyrrhocoris]|eukprot:XP_015653829.1 hypothetical protein ABB37_08666 [Leptomonas pyrrhocoris]